MIGLRRASGGRSTVAFAVAVLVAIALAVVGVVRGTRAVGGSDSSCYGLMARAFASGQLQPTSVLADAPWPNVPLTLAPGGFIASPLHADAASPICAPGMSLLMAPFAAVFGPDGIFWLTPLASAVMVLSAFAIATSLGGFGAGITAAILTATAPIVLYQAVQPMNDVLTAALWLAAIALAARPALSGMMIGLAILVRPNLAPIAIAIAMLPLLDADRRERRWRSLAIMIAASVPGVLVLLWLNDSLYGNALGSGYGDAANLFSTSHISANAANYWRALFQTQNVVPLVGLLAPIVLRGQHRKIAAVLLLIVALVVGTYLLYSPFPEWWYLRFLILPLVILLILTSVTGVRLLSRASMGGVIPIAAVIIGMWGVRTAADRQAFELQRMEGRYRITAEAVSERLPSNAVFVTVWESGSLRFHAGREIVMWDSLDPAWLDRSLTWLRSRGFQPYILVERREEPEFRDRFRGQSEVGALDWPPRLDLDRQVRIYDPADRARYLAGESYPTENVRQPRITQSPKKM